MADAFEDFLSTALAPPERAVDRQFVARVQAAIALEEQLAAQRRGFVTELTTQLVALAAVAAALWWLSRAAPFAHWLAESPAQALAVLIALFGFVVAAIALRPSPSNGFSGLARLRN